MKWEKVKLGDLCDITSSKRVHLAERVTYRVPFYCSKEIILKRKHEDVTECDFISENIWNDINKKYGTPHYRDILVLWSMMCPILKGPYGKAWVKIQGSFP